MQEKSTDGIFSWVVETKAPCAKDTANVIAYYSGSKSAYGINVQAMCTADYRFCAMSAISPGSTNDWVAWNRSSLAKAVARLPAGFHIIGDAAYPIGEKLLTPYPGRLLPPGSTNDWVAWNRSSLAKAVARLPAGFHIIGDAAYPIGEKLLTPYPGRLLPAGEDSFNFHLSQLRVKIEQSFGILVSTWGILWRPLRVQYGGRADLITAFCHLHNFLQDEKVAPIQLAEEDSPSGRNRPALYATQRTLPAGWQTEQPAPSRSGETPAQATIRTALELKMQWRPDYNRRRNS
ncbi:unnamed protein product [Ectocarpus sp. CCAP 1310/34]|nr:unnamed protein product [Ectocarpus sp. CCAP 1310/34]